MQKDAELILKMYELRTESLMRESRHLINSNFWPVSFDEIKNITTNFQNPLNAPLRQVSTYWEMVYGFAKYGAINVELLIDSCSEGLWLFAKINPFLDEIRSSGSAFAYKNTEWIATMTDSGSSRYQEISTRVKLRYESIQST